MALKPLFTEKDLLQQIASNMTKAEISKSRAVDDSKAVFKGHFEACLKVWQAFEKYLYDQVYNKGRLVDTQLAGIFFRLPTSS